MNTITIGQKQHECPSSWAEMKPWHLLLWVKILAKDIERTHAFALAVIGLYKIKPRTYFKMVPAQHVQLKNTLAFLAEENGLVRWLINYIKPYPWQKLYGPSDRLSTSTIQEFRYCERYYLAYERTGDQKYVDQLLACLYRPKGKSNLSLDVRQQLTQVLIIEHAAKMKRLSASVRAAIVFNYEGCRKYIFKKYPSIFKTGTSKPSNELPDLEDIIKTVAGGKFGAHTATADTEIYLFLNHLADEIAHAEKLNSK